MGSGDRDTNFGRKVRRRVLHGGDVSGKQVVVGLTGVDGAGAQFLYSLVRSRGLKPERCTFSPSVRPALLCPDESRFEFPAISFCEDEEVRHPQTRSRGFASQAVFLLSNVRISPNECIGFVKTGFQFLEEKCGPAFLQEGHLVLTSSMRMKGSISGTGLFQHSWNDGSENGSLGPFFLELHGGGEPGHRLAALPADFRISDAMLATWLHFADALQLRTSCIVAPGRLHVTGTFLSNLQCCPQGFRPSLGRSTPVDRTSEPLFLNGLKQFVRCEQSYETFQTLINPSGWHEPTKENSVLYT